MKGLYYVYSDNCTYYHEELIFCMTEETLYSPRFKEKLNSMFPETPEMDYLQLVIDGETVVLYDDAGHSQEVKIGDVEFF